jgi:hypothetical protein
MILSKPIRQVLEWSEDDDDALARRPTILGGLLTEVESAPAVGIGLAPRVPSLGSFESLASTVVPPPITEPRVSCRPTRRAPARSPEVGSARASARPTGRPSQFPF